MTERKIENESNNQLEIEKQKRLQEKQKRLAEKRKLEEASLSEEEKQKRLRERRKAAMQKKLEGLSEEEKQKILEERRKKARLKKLEEQRKLEKQKLEQEVPSNNSKEGETFIENIEANEKDMKKSDKESSKKNSTKIKNKGSKKESKNKKIKKEKKKLSKKAKIILAIILLLVIVAGIFIGKRIKDNGGGMQGIVATILGHDSSTLDNLPELRFVIIGQSQNLTDTIMICSYNPRSQKASILSMPRDTYTGNNKNRATAYDKINALYQQSPEKLLEEINQITGMDIKYYVHINTDGLVDLVDAIGGVEFDVPIDMNYDDTSQKLAIHLKAGYQFLDGNKAEQLVRFRHNNNGTTYPSEYGQEDIGRMRTQREFIKAIIKKMAKAENLTKVDDFIAIANKYVKTNMNFNSFKDYAPYALSFSADNVRTETLPGASEKCNGLWFYIYNKKETQTLVKDMFALEPVDDVTITDT